MSLSRIATLAADRRVHRAFHWLHLHELQLRQWQLQMIAIPAPSFAESTRAAWFLDRFQELGLQEVHLDEAGNALAVLPEAPPTHKGVPHVPLLGHGIAAARSSQQSPCILLSAHLDTVFPANTDCTPREDGPFILAPGACDNAAGLTALLAIAAALQYAELAPPCPILFAANVGEEGAGDLRGMRHIFAGPHNIATAIALEGSGNATIVDRALGSRRFRITVSGPGGHSWADAALPNPIFALAEALTPISRLELPLSPRTTLHCGTISGGTSVNSVPESATADLDLRSVSADQLDLTEAEILRTIRTTIDSINARTKPPLALEIVRIGDRPAAALAPDSPLMQSIHAVDRHLGIATELRIGSTDANWPLSLGIPALAIGCGGTAGGIHTLHEWYDPTGRELALRRILLHLLDACTIAITVRPAE
jgi:tripeptide aminopeptidase